MKKEIYTIDMLNGFAWECAIMNVIKRIRNTKMFCNANFSENCMEVEEVIKIMGIKFDENGEIV